MSVMATSFMWVAGDGVPIRFLRKGNFLFQPPAQSDADARSWGVGSSKDFEIRGILEKEPKPAGRTSYQADRQAPRSQGLNISWQKV
jgi:hypothetical protein